MITAYHRRVFQLWAQSGLGAHPRLSVLLKRRVVLLRDAPDHHLAMHMLPIGGHRVLVGAPSQSERFLGKLRLTDSVGIGFLYW